MKKLERALKEAKKIRKELLRNGEYYKDLGGACGHAAALLCYRLKDAKALRGGHFHKRRIEYGFGHWWVEITGFIVDPTATQFLRRGKAVHLEPIPSNHYAEDECTIKDHWSFIEENYFDMEDVLEACDWAKKELEKHEKKRRRA